MDVRKQIEGFEGRRSAAYPDPLTRGSPWTIGVGHTGPEVRADSYWTEEQIDAALTTDILRATNGLMLAYPWFASLNDPRQAVLVGMAFQMGLGGLAEFKHMLAAVRDEHWADAAQQMHLSNWYRQTPDRAGRLARQMETGEWQ